MNRREYAAERNLNLKACPEGTEDATVLGNLLLAERYIASLEAELEQLKTDNLDLMKQVEVIGKALDLACDFVKDATGACPLDTYDVCAFDEDKCDDIGVDNTWQCYKKYYLKKAGGK